jgi:hypothetical protein
MGFASIFRSRQRKLAWSYTAGGVLWRLHPADGGFLVGEDRDTAAKRVSFFCLDLSGNVVWERLQPTEPWWTGIEAVSGGIVFFHGFTSPNMPEHKNILAVDLMTGKQLWGNDELHWISAGAGVIYAGKAGHERKEVLELDARTGAVCRQLGDDAIAELGDSSAVAAGAIRFPVAVAEDAAHGEKMVEIGTSVGLRPQHVELLDIGDAAAIGFYDLASADPVDRHYRQHLVVVVKERPSIVFHDVLMERAVHPVPDTFFSWQETLLYIRERKTLCALPMNNSDVRDGNR